jgi:tRNA1(Val) A37 N6-methylase TrmN6
VFSPAEDGSLAQGVLVEHQWLSERHLRPAGIVEAGDELRADRALAIAKHNAVLWRGDYRNARQLLAAMRRRLERRPARQGESPADTFHRHRQAIAARTRVLNRLLIELGPGYRVDLPHAPDVSQACEQVYGPAPDRAFLPLAELLGVLGAHEWRRRGVWVPILNSRIHPHYGVFAPTRQEYLDLACTVPWPTVGTAFDIGTGTGVLAALLASRGAKSVVATDIENRAIDCARDNVDRLGLSTRIQVEYADVFPEGRADLVVCNPPWLPGTPMSALDAAVYDPNSRMLRHFLRELPHHLTPGGQAWLIISDLAERLGLRGELTGMITAAGLTVLDRVDTRPRHNVHRGDPLSGHRAAEITSLWRLSAGSEA